MENGKKHQENDESEASMAHDAAHVGARDVLERLANFDHAAYDRMMHARFQEEHAERLRDQQAYTDSHKWTPALRAAIWDKTAGKCWYCGKQTNPWRDYCIDHVVNWRVGGSMTIDNLVPCCRLCNKHKGPKTLEAFRTWMAIRANEPDTPHRFWFETQGLTLTPEPHAPPADHGPAP